MRQVGEPSVEEILESIKKVIARDNRAGAAEERRDREERGLPVEATPAAALENALENAPEDVLELGSVGEYADEDEPASAPDDEDHLIDRPLAARETVSSIGESLAALAMLAQPPAAPQIVRSGETSLEGMVRDLLRPELARWLDQNLPALVEKLVATEIARIVGKKG